VVMMSGRIRKSAIMRENRSIAAGKRSLFFSECHHRKFVAKVKRPNSNAQIEQ